MSIGSFSDSISSQSTIEAAEDKVSHSVFEYSSSHDESENHNEDDRSEGERNLLIPKFCNDDSVISPSQYQSILSKENEKSQKHVTIQTPYKQNRKNLICSISCVSVFSATLLLSVIALGLVRSLVLVHSTLAFSLLAVFSLSILLGSGISAYCFALRHKKVKAAEARLI